MTDYSDLLGDIKARMATAQQDLDAVLEQRPGAGYQVDEMGVKFNTTEEADEFLAWAKLEPGMDHFNHSEERMVLRSGWDDSGSVRFGLRLDFLRYPTDASWRIEVMVPSGPAPLHDVVPTATPIHAAFKVVWDDYTANLARMMRHRKLLGMCQNDYGLFAYMGAEPGDVPYLKPRAPRPAGQGRMFTP